MTEKETLEKETIEAETNLETDILYDAKANQRYAFEAKSGSDKYDTAHVFTPVDDDLYLEYVNNLNIKGEDDEVDTEISVAGGKLWDKVIIEVENIEFDEGLDWKSLISVEEKNESIDMLLAVAIAEPEEMKKGVRKLSTQETQTITTEAYFNGTPVRQTHVLRAKTPEMTKKFDRIQRKRYKQEQTTGLRRKPTVEYVPQDENLGRLYDEMAVSTKNFTADFIPLRFKTTVMYSVFAAALEQKK